MKNELDPTNPVARLFLLHCGIHPAKAPEPPKPEPLWKPEGPNPGGQYINPSRGIAKWFQ